MTTSDWISLLALVVAAVSSIGNYFYTNRKLQLMTNPMLDAELRLFRESDLSNPRTAFFEGQNYQLRHESYLYLRMRNLSSSLSITQIHMRLEYGRHITRWWMFWQKIPREMRILNTLNPLEQRESRLSRWDELAERIFPEEVKLLLQTDKEGHRFACYAERKPLAFRLKLIIKYTAGIPSAPTRTLQQEYHVSSLGRMYSTPTDGIFWTLSERVDNLRRDSEWFNA